MLDTYAETLGIDKTAVTLPTYAELNALTEEQKSTSGFTYWSRSLNNNNNVYNVNSNGNINNNNLNYNIVVRPDSFDNQVSYRYI